jgi:hypothetical protein
MRWSLGLLLFLSPIIGDRIGLPLFAVSMGALLAYDGVTARSLTWPLLMLIGVECVWGIDLGTLSLAYATTLLCLAFAESVVAFVPFSRVTDWAPLMIIRGGITAAILAWLMSFFSVLIQAWVYGHGSLGILISAAYRPWASHLALIALLSAGALIVLHRIRIPFRRRVVFNTQ